MKTKFCKLLRCVLIVMLTITPLRGVIAGSAPCSMHKMSMNNAMMAAASGGNGRMGRMHMQGMHAMNMSNQSMAVNFTAKNMATGHNKMAVVATKKHHCCCCNNGRGQCLSGQCDMNFYLTFFIQPTLFTPAIAFLSQLKTLQQQAVAKEFSPPFRPPLKLA